MSLVGMDLGPKMDWTLHNGLYQRFKVFKERCIDILSGILHATPEEKRYIIFVTGWEKKVQNLFPNGPQKVKLQMVIQRQCQKRSSKHIGNFSRTIQSQDRIVSFQLLN